MTVANPVRPLNLPPLVMVTDRDRAPDPLPMVARLPRGSAVILRHYGDPGRQALASALTKLARRQRLLLLVAADWRLAAAVGADGIHLPEGLARHGVLGPLLGWARRHGRMITMACHSPAALARAGRLGAHGALLSPVFATASHPGAPTIGPARFRLWARGSQVAVHALGGTNPHRLRQLRGAAGFASVTPK